MKRHSNTIYRLLAAVTFVAALTVMSSCQRELVLPDVTVPDGQIVFGSEGLDLSVETKATEVTSLSSFYVSAVTGSAGSEVSAWTSTQFNQVPASNPAVYNSDKYWPAVNPEYKFYGSNLALNFAADGTYVNASNATDVVCAYLSSPTYRTKNTLSFEHIFARLCRVDVAAQTGYTISNISMYITPKTGGTYNLRTGAGHTDGTGWSSIATGSATLISNKTGATNNDIYMVPGTYSITCSWVSTDPSGASVTHTNEVCNVPLTGGRTNNISCVLGGDITFGVDLQDYADYDYRDNLDYFTIYSPQAQTIRWKVGIAYYDSIEDYCNDYAYDYDETVELIENNISGHIEYSKDSGKTWFSIDASIVGAEIPVNAGDVIRFYGDNDGYSCYGLLDGQTPHIFFEFEEPTYVYGDMSSLLSDPSSMDDSAFAYFFLDNDNLLSIKSKPLRLPDKTSPYSYFGMFEGCTSLTAAPELPATTLKDYCYYYMFYGCTSLTTAPELPATTLAQYCYSYMFYNCTSLTAAPELPATTLANGCYSNMFYDCRSLKTAPELPATTLASSCYSNMFSGCSSLTSAPALPATTLANECYNGMFRGCTSLKKTPELPATTVANSCYTNMFQNCSSLTTAPALPATTLKDYCYYSMFYGCTLLTTAPAALPATTLANYCYTNMFQNCSSLTTAPALPATTLVSGCYNFMFYGCSSLNYIKALFTTTPSTSFTRNWVGGVAPTGTFVKSAAATWDVVGNNGVPTGWLVQEGTYDEKDNLAYLTFYCDEAGTIGWKCSVAGLTRTIQYSKDFGATWTNLKSTTSGATVSVSAGDIVWFKGNNTEYANSSNYNYFTLSNKTHVYGNVNSLTGNNTSVSQYCFNSLFYNCSNLYTYEHKKIILPATTLADGCYNQMFKNCTSLTVAPELPATTLALSCYKSMFESCTSLTVAPELPATTLESSCYYGMFTSCTSLIVAPELPATTLVSECYYCMFMGCTSLTVAPELPATTLVERCYYQMFKNCTSLIYIKALCTTNPTINASFWVQGVAATGIFVKNSAATWTTTGNNGVPTGWTVITE